MPVFGIGLVFRPPFKITPFIICRPEPFCFYLDPIEPNPISVNIAITPKSSGISSL